MTYDPQAAGAMCDLCPLRDERIGGPVKPTCRGSDRLFVGQQPTESDVVLDEPLVGASGREWERGIEVAGWFRHEVDTNFALACQPPVPLKFYLGMLKGRNKALKKKGEPQLANPLHCCAPRLLREAAPFPFVVPLGGAAARILIPNMRGSFDNNRGKMVEIPLLPPGVEPPSKAFVPGRKILTSYNPGRVVKDKGLRKVFHVDMARAKRFYEGNLLWKDPWILIVPTLDQIHRFLSEVTFEATGPYAEVLHYLANTSDVEWTSDKVHWYDCETSFAPGWKADLHCIQIGTQDHVIVIPLQSRVHRGYIFYTPEELTWIRSRLSGWAQDHSILKIGHNSGVFDRMVVEQPRHMGAEPLPHIDNILLKRSAQPDTPHNLGFVAGFYTDIHDWKGDKTALEAKSDEDLWDYGGKDTAATARCTEPMAKECTQRGQLDVVRLDHKIQSINVGMTRIGMLIDQEKRLEFEIDYLARVRKWAFICRKLLQGAGIDPDQIAPKLAKKKRATITTDMGLAVAEIEEGWDIDPTMLGEDFLRWNPGSHVQLRHILFEEWGLEPPSDLRPKELLTMSGELSTSDTVMRSLLQRGHLLDYQRRFIRAVREFRKAAKVLGTYLLPLRPFGQAGPKGVVHEDGRIHPRWLNFIPITGRIASRGPNAQNIISFLRAMFIPAPGHVYVGADKDQLEHRIASQLWGVTRYINAFNTMDDPHQVTMALVFGQGDLVKGIKAILAMDGAPSAYGMKDFRGHGEFYEMRRLAKTVQFGAQYGARGHVLHRLITSVENDKGEFAFGHLVLSDAEALRESWLSGCPEYELGWQKEKQEALRQGFLLEPFGGRRRDFVDGGDNLSEIVNFKVQGGAAALVNIETVEVVEAIPFGCWSEHTGLVNQCHDQLVVEVPEDKGELAKGLMMEVMGNRYVPGWDIPFTAGPAIGPNWKSV